MTPTHDRYGERFDFNEQRAPPDNYTTSVGYEATQTSQVLLCAIVKGANESDPRVVAMQQYQDEEGERTQMIRTMSMKLSLARVHMRNGVKIVVQSPKLELLPNEDVRTHGKYFNQLVSSGWVDQPKISMSNRTPVTHAHSLSCI